MPVSYGQVAGVKHYATQPEYDPDNPKRSIYQPKTYRPARTPKPAPPRTRTWGHGVKAWMEGRCECDECREAYLKMRERDKERKRLKSEAKHMNEARTLAQCTRCGNWKPVAKFPNIGTSRNDKWVCIDCKTRLEVPPWRR